MQIFYKAYRRFLTFVGDIMFALKPPRCKSKHILETMKRFRVGDIVLRGYTYYLDSYLIPGTYTHSGIVIDKDGTMMHSISEGVSRIHIIDFIKDADDFIIIRPTYREDMLRMAIDTAKMCEGKEYDIYFDGKDQDMMYCHELTAYCLAMAKISVMMSCVGWIVKKYVYLGEDIIKTGKKIYELSDEL